MCVLREKELLICYQQKQWEIQYMNLKEEDVYSKEIFTIWWKKNGLNF